MFLSQSIFEGIFTIPIYQECMKINNLVIQWEE